MHLVHTEIIVTTFLLINPRNMHCIERLLVGSIEKERKERIEMSPPDTNGPRLS